MSEGVQRHAGKELFDSPGQHELIWNTRRRKPVKVVNCGFGETANVPAGLSHARPKCAEQSLSFVVFLTSGASNIQPTQETPGTRPATLQGTVCG